MSQPFKERAIILVKAFPQPSQKYEETVCCAGITEAGAFVRLYPVRFRHLDADKRFDRWDVVEYQALRPIDDWRPESRHVDETSIKIVQSRSLSDDAQRVRLWAPHVSASLVELKAENVATHKSLGVVRPDEGSIKFRHRKLRDSEDDRQLQAAFKQVSLLGEGLLASLPVEYDFSYSFTCAGHAHTMKIHDWEVQAAYLSFKARYGERALEMLTQEYEQRIPTRNLHLVMGTMKAHPRQFIVIGLLRSALSPDDVTRQGSLI